MGTHTYNTARPLVLADQIRANGRVLDVQSQSIRPFGHEMFAEATPIVLDSVSDWWDENNPDEWPDPRLEPCARLPWRRTWAEWLDRNDSGLYKGLLMSEIPMPEGTTALDFVMKAAAATNREMPQIPTGDLWKTAPYVCWVYGFLWYPGASEVLQWAPIMFPVSEVGETEPNGEFLVIGQHHTSDGDDLAEAVHRDLNVFRLFTAMIRVKGSTMDEVPIPRQARRRAERQAIADGGPPPWIHYKTLTLKLLGGETGTRRDVSGPIAGVPRHKVRAHLADFRKGQGLFGKYRQLVWVKEHRRGYERLGAIAKTYDTKIEETE